jgi:mannose-6-phosphate isomerase-like protein (cupin superfamily)
MGPEAPCREDPRPHRRRRRVGRMLGTGSGQPYHCHPEATEIYFCFEGGGKMRTPSETIDIVPGTFVVHPAGEVHEYANGPQRTLLFRVRYGADMRAHHVQWRDNPGWKQSEADAEYYRRHPVGGRSS